MAAADWPAVRAIYLQGIGTGLATFETAAPEWEAWDAAHLPHSRLVACAKEDAAIAGWAVLSPVSRRAVYAGVAEVTVFVGAAHRGMGCGRALLAALIGSSEQHGIWTLQSVIIAENAASIGLHQAMGFRVVGRRERIGCLNGRWRDTVWMERRSPVVGI